MAKEEKLVINKDIVNLISYKESYEEIVNSLSFEIGPIEKEEKEVNEYDYLLIMLFFLFTLLILFFWMLLSPYCLTS